MSSVIPNTMRACLVPENDTVVVREIPVPVIKRNEVLIKVYAVAQNPVDWKSVCVPRIKKPGTILGVDFSGIVVKMGDQVTNVKVGDHVAGFTHGGQYPDHGAFAEYTKLESDLVWVVPPGTVSHEAAATITCGALTAAQALYHPTRLGLPDPPTPINGKWVRFLSSQYTVTQSLTVNQFFVYAGSTSVGLYAIQFARLSGFKVVTVASPHNHKLLKEFGADAVFDYKDPDVVEQIQNITGNTIDIALDTHADEASQLLTVRTFGPKGGHLIVILPISEAAVNERPDVKVQMTLLYTALGRAFSWVHITHPESQEDRAHYAASLPRFAELVKAGSIRPNPIKIWEGGLESIQEGLDYMRSGKVSAEKIVYRVVSE